MNTRQEKTISVIIPCHNASKLINRCFESIEDQTLGLKEMEIIFIDDLSADDTIDKLKKIETAHPQQITVIQHSENKGPGAARNTGLEHAKGKYIAFVDADDMLRPTMLEALLSACEKYGCDMAECDYEPFTDTRPMEKNYHDISFQYTELMNIDYKRQFILDSLKTAFFPEGILHEEDVFFSGLSLFYIQSYCRTASKLYLYYRNDNGITHSSYGQIRRREDVHIIGKLLSELRNRGLFEDSLKHFGQEFEFFCIWKGCLDPFRKIFNTDMSWNDQLTEASFYADYINTLFPAPADNMYLKGLNEDFYIVSRQIIFNAQRKH